MTVIQPSVKVAVLLNGGSAQHEDVKACFNDAIKSVEKTAMIDFYDPIIAQEYPKQEEYDLIVLSGGGTDPMSQQPWVLKMQEFVRSTVNKSPPTKLVGICWGHQTISVSLGGVVAPMGGYEVCQNPQATWQATDTCRWGYIVSLSQRLGATSSHPSCLKAVHTSSLNSTQERSSNQEKASSPLQRTTSASQTQAIQSSLSKAIRR